jgi:alkylation response protein AidB-like acyl-CoA dehydrogenase
MEIARRLDDDLVADMDAAGLFSILVPRRWGGAGLGPVELNTVLEVLARGDVSTAWVTSFYNLHNWFLCRFPVDVQRELYSGRSSVLAAAVLSRPGTAVPVHGGYLVTGRWGYATGILHGSHSLVPAMCDGVASWCLVERDQLELLDDWDVAAMAATGSVTIVADSVFVPEARVLAVVDLMHPTEHPGSFHEEQAYRLPFSALALTTASIYLGALDAGVELGREWLQRSSGPGDVPRIERQMMRVNWVNAHQTARVLRLVRDAATSDALRASQRGTPLTLEEEAQTQLDIMTLLQSAKQALRTLLDASGSSSYRNTDLLRRLAGDIGMISTHALNGEYDVAMDRHARWLLGLGQVAGDPRARMR